MPAESDSERHARIREREQYVAEYREIEDRLADAEERIAKLEAQQVSATHTPPPPPLPPPTRARWLAPTAS